MRLAFNLGTEADEGIAKLVLQLEGIFLMASAEGSSIFSAISFIPLMLFHTAKKGLPLYAAPSPASALPVFSQLRIFFKKLLHALTQHLSDSSAALLLSPVLFSRVRK